MHGVMPAVVGAAGSMTLGNRRQLRDVMEG
jgi:hypothetical protein